MSNKYPDVIFFHKLSTIGRRETGYCDAFILWVVELGDGIVRVFRVIYEFFMLSQDGLFAIKKLAVLIAHSRVKGPTAPGQVSCISVGTITIIRVDYER